MPGTKPKKHTEKQPSTGWVRLSSLPGQKVDDRKYGFNYWKIEDGSVWHQGRRHKRADPASFEVREDYSQVFIARDINHVFHGWSLVPRIDRETFREVANGYWVDQYRGYCEHETSITPLKGEDASHFKYIGGPYARDSVFAYYAGRVIKTCREPLKLQLMDPENVWYAGDQKRIFYDGAEIAGVDFESWTLIKGGFSKDKKTVYFGSKRLPGVNLESWEQLEGAYSRDRDSVYQMQFKISGADPGSWECLPHHYSKDANAVYYGWRVIPAADSQSFKVDCKGNAKDRKRRYVNGVPQG